LGNFDVSQLESRNYLFFECPFAQLCWQFICPSWTPPFWIVQLTPVQTFVASLKQAIHQPFAMEIIILVCWTIWNNRNNFIFKGL
jgi:hypothetical protein